jgi:prepilin-type N-terminal cleavage/methylation domain-containing protein/prepilin-type processing-associated H-X9-DG protein
MKRASAFTLVELIVVIGIVGLLLALALPAIMNARAAADMISCKNNVRNCVFALIQYHTDYSRLPSPKPLSNFDPSGIVTWRVLVWPYLDESTAFAKVSEHCRLAPDPVQNVPHTGLDKTISVFTCPSDSRLLTPIQVGGYRLAMSSYIGVSGNGVANGVLFSSPDFSVSFRDITDGLSNTLMIGERPPPDSFETGFLYPKRFDPISEAMTFNTAAFAGFATGVQVFGQFGPGSTENRSDMFHFWSLHRGGGVFGFCDGSVRFLNYSSRDSVYKMASRNGGEVVTIDE